MRTTNSIAVVSTILVLFFCACIKLPDSNKSAFILTSPSFENQLGADGYREVLSEAKINRDPRLNEILQRVGNGIAAQTSQTGFDWQFTLIESKEQNAWCMPGGKVAVYTGILPAMQNEAGMAAVLGHEVAHAILRHSGQRITQSMVLDLGMSVAELSLGNSKQKNTLLGLMGAGATVGIMLPYSRSHETDADLVGLKYMAKAGYDPRAAVSFWQRFQQSSAGAPPEFLSTHPASSTRIRNLEAHLPEALQLYDAAAKKFGNGVKL